MITRRSFLGQCLTAAALTTAAPKTRADATRPNVLFILVDDLGWADLGCYGSSFYRTPNIDRLAASGTRFTQAYAASPVCSPTRAALMTGKHPVRLDMTDWIPGRPAKDRRLLAPEDEHQLPLEEETLAETLNDAGYETFYAGKWHLGSEGFYPEHQGFDINKGGHEAGSPPGGYYAPYKNPKLEDGPEGEYLPNRLTDECIAFMKEKRNAPFLAFLAHYTVHTPIQASQRHITECQERAEAVDQTGPAYRDERDARTRIRQDNPAYASMVEALDENIGRLLETLDATGQRDNTLIVFTSDNGGLSTYPARRDTLAPTSNEPLRAGKGWCYEGGIRVPLIVAGPGVQPGSTTDMAAISMDLYPTLLGMLGLPPQPERHTDGLSLVPWLARETNPHARTLHWHYPHYHGSAWRPGAAIREGDWKLIAFYDEETEELYNLRKDPGESENLAATLPEKRIELSEKLRAWQERIGARMPRPNPDYTQHE